MFGRFRFNLVLLFLVLTHGLSGMETVKLTAPDFSEDKIINKKVGIKALHRTAFKLKSVVHYHHEKPIIIIHNYGNEEAGWTYAPGSMEVAYEKMQETYAAIGKTLVPANEKIAVLGAGVNGLMIANKLVEEGYDVTVYANYFSPDTFSDIHMGVFIPVLEAQKNGNELIERLEILSYKTYQSWADRKNNVGYRGVYPIDLYVVNNEDSFDLLINQGLVAEPKLISIDFGNSSTILAKKHQSFVFNTSLIMKEMMKKAKRLGVKFVKMKINCISDYMNLGADVVFNCIGHGSNKIFKDSNTIPFIGHTIDIRNPIRMNYVIYIGHPDGTYTYWFSKDKKTTLAGTFLEFNQEGVTEDAHVQHLFDRAKKLVMNEEIY